MENAINVVMMSKSSFRPRIRVLDILVWLMLVTGSVLFLGVDHNKQPGDSVRLIWTGGNETYSLNENRVIIIETLHGKALIRIKDGQAGILESPCLNKICIKSGKISHIGECIICAPECIKLEIVDKNTLYDVVIR